MAKIKEAIGLDIGSNTVKIIHAVKDLDSIRVLNYKVFEKNNDSLDASSVYEIISEFIKGSKGDVPIVASIEGHHVFTRVFKLPAVGKSRLAKIVGYEAQQQVPFPIDDVVWSYQCVRKVSAQEADVVLVAAKKDVVETFIDSYKILGFSFRDVVAPVVGLFNFMEFNLPAPQKEQAVLVLDIGAKTTNIVIAENENLWFRTVPLGGDVITKAIGQEYNISQKEAEELKKNSACILMEGMPDENQEKKKMSSCIVRSINRLTGEIARSIEVYSSSFNSLGVKNITITGGTSSIDGLGNFLAKKFKADLKSLDALKGVSVKDELRDIIGKDIPSLSVSFGLALQGLGLGRFELSLLPKAMLREQQFAKKQGYLVSTAVLLIFLGFSYTVYNSQMSNIYNSNVKKLISEKKAVDLNVNRINIAESQLNKVKQELDIISNVTDARVLWLNMILDLEEIIPQNTWLTGIKPVINDNAAGDNTGGRQYRKTENDLDKLEFEVIYSENYIDLEIHGKTTGLYQQIVSLRDALDKSGYFISGKTEVVLASPPKQEVRDFVIKVRLKAR